MKRTGATRLDRTGNLLITKPGCQVSGVISFLCFLMIRWGLTSAMSSPENTG